MKEILDDLEGWFAEGETTVALATVVATWGSAPRRVGAKMALTADGRISGSVSGGCVEGAVFEESREVLQTGRPMLVGYGVTDEQAWAVTLWCAFTNVYDSFMICPILAVTSPTKGCGKSLLLDVISRAVPKPLSVTNITASPMYRTIEKVRRHKGVGCAVFGRGGIVPVSECESVGHARENGPDQNRR